MLTALRHLSTLPTLKTLTVKLFEISRPRTRPFLSTDRLFCSAEELEFIISDLDLVTRPRDQVFHGLLLSHHRREALGCSMTADETKREPTRYTPSSFI